jgi:Spy/CpxP family protein refolding chaperone
MTQRFFGIGATAAAVALAAAFVAAQGATTGDQAAGTPVVQDQAQPEQGVLGQGRGQGPGRGFGRGQGLGPGQGLGQGRGVGRGQMLGPRGGRGVQAAGRRAGAGQVGPRMGRRGGGGLAGLDLTDEQRATITDLQRATHDQAAPLQDELAFARRTLHRELFADARDDATIASLAKQVAALDQQLADLHLKQATAMAGLLTPEQRETMRLREGRGRGHGAGPAGRGGRGRGGPAGR